MSFHESQYDGWSSRIPTIVSIYSEARWLCPMFAESYQLLCVTLSKNLWLFMFEMHLIHGITDGWQGCESPPPAKLNVKPGPGPHLASILVFTILLISVDCCLFRFSECFPVISGFCTVVQYRICYCFSIIGSQWAPFS